MDFFSALCLKGILALALLYHMGMPSVLTGFQYPFRTLGSFILRELI